ncbi:DUF5801 repeats-in-toxin domain-containing protein, partial [Rhizobium rosettiformans]
YTYVGGALVAYANVAGNAGLGLGDRVVFTLTLDKSTGEFVYRQYDQLDHVAGGGENTALKVPGGSIAGIDFGAVIEATDRDGDTVGLDGKIIVTVVDDMPETSIWTDSTVRVDETGGNNDDNLTDPVSRYFASQLFTAVGSKGNDPDMSVRYAKDDVVDFSIDGGADDTGFFTGSVNGSLTLKINDTDSGLFTTDGQPITLSKEGELVVGRIANGTAAFAIHMDSSGQVTVAQYLSLKHSATGNNFDDSVNLGDKISAVLSVTDYDQDTVEKTIAIGTKIAFDDDGPWVGSNSTVYVEDDDLSNGIEGGTNDDFAPQNVTGVLSHDFGADGGSIAWVATSTATAGGATGFAYERSEDGTLLIKQNGTTVITVSLDAATGEYKVTQVAPLMHANGDTENNQTFTLTYKVTDGDNDSINGTLTINVDDDMPKVANAAVMVTADEDDIASALSSGNHPYDGLGDLSGTEWPLGAVITQGTAADAVSFGADGAKAGGGFSFASDALSTMTTVGLSSKGVGLS